jgi:hypothetical protein
MRVSAKQHEVGDAAKRANRDDSPVNTGRRDNATPPHSGEGCGDTLNGRIFFKESSSLRQKTPPSRISSGKIVSAAHGEVSFSQ